jgi:hypothetical protein
MSSRLKLRRPSHGTVIAYVALFVALGGSAFAFNLGKNSVGTKQLRKNAVTAVKIKSNAVNGGKVEDGSLTGVDLANGTIPGAKLDLGSLGTVPSATQAGDAHTLDGQSAEQISAASKLRCASGMTLYHGICFEENVSGTVEWNTAASHCWNQGLRLPTLGELLGFEHNFSSQPEGEWTEPEWFAEGEGRAWVGSASNSGSSWGTAEIGNSFQYRCVTSASNG